MIEWPTPCLTSTLRLAAETPRRPWGSFLIGCLLQGLATALLLFGALPVAEESPKPPNRRTTPLIVPALRKATPARDIPPPRAPQSKARVPLPAPPATAVKDRVDLNSIEISVVEDTSNQLPEVVRQHQGVLAMVERGDQSIAHYLFEPPDWKMRDEIADVSGRIRFSMSPPSRWALLRSLASLHSIEMEKYEVDALFDGGYARCLEQEIRKRAEESPGAGRVRSALVAFMSSRSCGIDVVNLEFTGR